MPTTRTSPLEVPSPTVPIIIRLVQDDVRQLNELAFAARMNRTEYVRDAIHRLYADLQEAIADLEGALPDGPTDAG